MKLHFLLAGWLGWISCANATSFYIRPFSEFIKETPNIIRGVVLQQNIENGITPEGGSTIYTFARVEVKETLKGPIHSAEIRIRKVGGSKDGYTLEIPGSPEFKVGEESVFFLTPEKEDQSYEVASLELGKFSIEEKGGERFLKGGIFNYSNSNHSEGAAENQRSWSLKDLKETLQNKTSSVPTSISSSSAPAPSSPPPNPSPGENLEPNKHEPAAQHSVHPDQERGIFFIMMGAGALIAALAVYFFRRTR